MDVLEKIDKLRLQKDWTFYKLAEESMIPQSTILNMFARKTLPSLTTLEAICSGLGISLSDFFLDENDIKNQEEIVRQFSQLPPKEQNAVKHLIQDLLTK